VTWRGRTLFVFVVIVLLFVFLAGPASSRIDDSYQEKAPLVLYDDNTDFWLAKGGSEGNIGVSIAASTLTVKNGASSLLVGVTTGQYMYMQVGHDYGSGQDWSAYENLCFWFYGSNSSITVEVALAAPDNSNQYWVMFQDNFTGWARLVFPLLSMEKIGTPNLSNVRIIAFFFFSAPSNFYIDRLILDASSNPQTTSSATSPTTSPALTPILSPTSTTTSAPSDWFSENWRWIALLVAIGVIVVVQVVVQVARRRQTSKR
jgi:hypothetical protein